MMFEFQTFFTRCDIKIAKRLWLIIGLFMLSVSAMVMAGDFGLSEKLLEQVKDEYGMKARGRLVAWQELIAEGSKYDEMEKLSVVNDFFNELRFVDDLEHWGENDYWATPIEFIVTNGGDCEDFSIAKYFTLKEMGVAVEKMLITYVKALELNQSHMVLTYYSDPLAEPLVLDNLIEEIRPASTRTDLAPVYSFNGDGLWLAKERGLGKRVGGSERLSLWTDLGLRMERQGLRK